MKSNLKKIYITGVTGFIGSQIAKLFKENSYHVIGIVKNSATTASEELGIEIIESDLIEKGDLILKPAEAIIHCATANDILSKNTEAGLLLSIVGTSKLLESASKAKISNIIFFSTLQVYGTELVGYFDELTPVNCKTSYAINHYLGEELCKFYCKTRNFNITVLRPSNVYGVPTISTVNRKTLVPTCFVNEAINHGSITLLSSGKQIRNFISTDQVAEIVLKTVKKFPKGFSTRNCGSNFYASMLEVANIVSDQYQKKFKKKIIIKISSDMPEVSNIFYYKSKFIKHNFTDKQDKDKMIKTINHLLKLKKTKNC